MTSTCASMCVCEVLHCLLTPEHTADDEIQRLDSSVQNYDVLVIVFQIVSL